MERIWAPWRIEFIMKGKPDGCFLCEKPREDNDVSNYILYRGKRNFVILNSYPYNPGHLLVAPYQHIPSLEDLDDEVLDEHIRIVCKCIKVLRQAMQPEGFNTGTNMGKIAGAGLSGHVHSHIVPRWQGDTNFMPVLSDTRVMPQALADTYKLLKEKFT